MFAYYIFSTPVFPDEVGGGKSPKISQIPKYQREEKLFLDFKSCLAATTASKQVLNKISETMVQSTINKLSDEENCLKITTELNKSFGNPWICWSDLGGGHSAFNGKPDTYACFKVKDRWYNVVQIDCSPDSKLSYIKNGKIVTVADKSGHRKDEPDNGWSTEGEDYADEPDRKAPPTKLDPFNYDEFYNRRNRKETVDESFCVPFGKKKYSKSKFFQQSTNPVPLDGACIGNHGTTGNCCGGTYCHKNDPSWSEGRCYNVHKKGSRIG